FCVPSPVPHFMVRGHYQRDNLTTGLEPVLTNLSHSLWDDFEHPVHPEVVLPIVGVDPLAHLNVLNRNPPLRGEYPLALFDAVGISERGTSNCDVPVVNSAIG